MPVGLLAPTLTGTITGNPLDAGVSDENVRQRGEGVGPGAATSTRGPVPSLGGRLGVGILRRPGLTGDRRLPFPS